MRHRHLSCKMAPAMLTLALAVGACYLEAGPDDPGASNDQPAGSVVAAPAVQRRNKSGASITAPLEVSRAAESLRAAFRATSDGFAGGRASYRADLHADGALRFAVPTTKQQRTATLHVQTTALRRGSVSLVELEHPARLDKRGCVVIERGGGVAEQLCNRAEGTEQTWRFARRPRGDGDLEVRVRVDGLPHARRAADGHHFVDPRTGVGVRYGHATWIDARGGRTALEVAHDGQELVVRVSAQLLARSTFPALLDPIISPAQPVDDTTHSAQAPNGQERPAIARNGTNYMVVWTDYRELKHTVYGALVSPSGTVLSGTSGVKIAASASQYGAPKIASDGAGFLVTYQRGSGSGFGTTGYYHVYAQRLDGTGHPVGPAIAVATTGGYALDPAVAYGGGTYLVVYEQGYEIKGRWITPAGVVSSSFTVASDATPPWLSRPAAAFNGSRFLVAFDRNLNQYVSPGGWRHQIGVVSMTPNGQPGAATTIATFNNHSYSTNVRPRVSSGGGGYSWIVWDAVGSDGKSRASAALLGSTGSPQCLRYYYNGYFYCIMTQLPLGNGVGVDVAGSTHPHSQQTYATWQDGADIKATRIYYQGYGTYPGFYPSATTVVSNAADYQQRPAIARPPQSSTAFVVWQDGRYRGSTSAYSIFGTSLDASAKPPSTTSATLISTAANTQEHAASAFGNNTYLVAWTDNRHKSATDVYAARVSKTGAVLDPAGVLLSKVYVAQYNLSVPTPGHQRYPAVASNGYSFLVAWANGEWGTGGIGANTVSSSGAAGSQQLLISSTSGEHYSPQIAFDGTNYLVVWSVRPGSEAKYHIYGARVSSSGYVYDTQSRLLVQNAGSPALAYGGGTYLLSYVDRSVDPPQVKAVRVSTGAQVVGAPVTLAQGYAAPTVTYGASEFLVGWSGGWSSSPVRAMRVSTAGAVVSSVISVNSSSSSSLHAAFDGRAYLLTWRRGTGTIEGARVALDGSVLEKLALTSGSERGPFVTADGSGGALVTYDAYVEAVTARRVRARVLQWTAQGASCSTDTACHSLQCVDGVCCNNACGGGVSTDCIACSLAAGGRINGVCTQRLTPSCSMVKAIPYKPPLFP